MAVDTTYQTLIVDALTEWTRGVTSGSMGRLCCCCGGGGGANGMPLGGSNCCSCGAEDAIDRYGGDAVNVDRAGCGGPDVLAFVTSADSSGNMLLMKMGAEAAGKSS